MRSRHPSPFRCLFAGILTVLLIAPLAVSFGQEEEPAAPATTPVETDPRDAEIRLRDERMREHGERIQRILDERRAELEARKEAEAAPRDEAAARHHQQAIRSYNIEAVEFDKLEEKLDVTRDRELDGWVLSGDGKVLRLVASPEFLDRMDAVIRELGGEPIADAPPSAEARPTEVRVSVAASDVLILQLAKILEVQTELTFAVHGEAVEKRVSVMAQDRYLEDVLTEMCSQYDLLWWPEFDGTIAIGDRDYYERNIMSGSSGVVTKLFRPEHITSADLEAAIRQFGILTPESGSCVADERTNKLIVNDSEAALARVTYLLKAIDFPRPEPSPTPADQ